MAKQIPPVAQVLELPVPPGKKASDYLTAYKSWVFSATQATSEKVASTELKLFKRTIRRGNLTIDEVDEHEAMSLLGDVNDFMTNYHLREITQVYLDLTGECYWALLRDSETGPPVELWPLRPDWVTVVPSKQNFIEGYRYSPGGLLSRDAVFFKPKDIIPFKYPNPLNPYRGRGQVQGADMAIDIDTFSAEWNRNYFFNSALPGLAFTTDQSLSEQQIKRFMELWQSKFQGRTNAHKIAVMGKGLKPVPLTNTPVEMGFAEQRRMMRDEILGVFRVPKSVVGVTEDVNLANAVASERQFAEHVIKPRLIRFVAYLNEFYLRPNWPDEDLFFDFVDPVPEDTELKLKVYDNGLKNGWLTINEVRQEENRTPAEGGDNIYLPMMLQPVGQVARLFGRITGKKSDQESGMLVLPVKGQKKVRKFNMPVPPRTLRQLRKEAIKKDLKHDLYKLVTNLMVEENGKSQKPKVAKQNTKFPSGWDESRRKTYWEKMIAKTDVLEEKMISMVAPLFREQQQEVEMKVDNFFKSYKPKRRKATDTATGVFLFNMVQENKRWLSTLKPFIRNILEDKGEEVLAFLGVSGSLDLTEQAAAAYLRLDGVNFIKDVNRTTRDDLRKTLSEGLQKEESIDQIKRRVQEVFDKASGFRAQMIARTEVARSTTFATLESYRQSEIVEMKEWLTAADERVDSVYCAELEGEAVPINEDFDVAGESVDGPPIHPNCRCTVIPVIKSGRSISPPTEKAEEKVTEVPIIKAKAEIDSYLEGKKKKVVEEAKAQAEEEKKGMIAEISKLRDRMRKALYGSKRAK